MKQLLFISIVLLSLQACKKDATVDLPEERPFVREFYTQGKWLYDPGGQLFAFDFTVGRPVSQDFFNLFFCKNSSKNINGYKTIEAHFDATVEDMIFRFWSPIPATGNDGEPWTRAELVSLIQPGKTFEVTGAPGQAEISMTDPLLEYSSLLYTSTQASVIDGYITIIYVEDYQWTSTLFDGSKIDRTGLKVLIRYSAFLGVQTLYGDQLLDAGVTDGEASIILEYI